MDNTDLSNNFIDNMEIVTETIIITQPDTQPITEIISETITEPIIVTTTQIEPITETTTQIEPVPVTETTTQIEPVPVTETTTQIEPITETTTQIEPITETTTQIEPVTETTTQIEPITETTTQIEPITETTTQIEPVTNTDVDISKNINLKNSINVFDPNVKNIYRPKNSWGPVIWNFIHTISIIDFLENEMYVNEVKKYLQSVFNILPCKHCCETYKIWIDKLDTIDINERMVLFKWSVDLHNEVNQKLNKQTLTYEQAVEIWCNKLPELPLL